MPVRRKANRRRADVVEALSQLFATGIDWDQEAREIGVATSSYDFPTDLAHVGSLWSEHGVAFMAGYSDPYWQPWALTEFGPPSQKRRAGSR